MAEKSALNVCDVNFFWLQLLNEIKDVEAKVLNLGTTLGVVIPAFQCISGRREGGFEVLLSGELEK